MYTILLDTTRALAHIDATSSFYTSRFRPINGFKHYMYGVFHVVFGYVFHVCDCVKKKGGGGGGGGGEGEC